VVVEPDQRRWSSQASHERLQATERSGLDAITDAGAVDLAADEPRLLQHLEVLRDRRLRQRQLLDDIAADARVSPGEEPQDLDASRMSDRLAERRELLVGLRPSTARLSGAVFPGVEGAQQLVVSPAQRVIVLLR
jgi:hypothetical protein